MRETRVNEEVRNRNASDQLGWRLNLVEANARAITSHFEVFGIDGALARKFQESLDEIVKTVRDRFMEATGGK